METQQLQRVRETPVRAVWLGLDSASLLTEAPTLFKKIAEIVDKRMHRNPEGQQQKRGQLSAE